MTSPRATSSEPNLDAAAVARAADRIANGVVHTHSAVSQVLSEITGANVVLKFENLQFTGSFKDRGSLNRLLEVDTSTSNGVIAMSAGNHAQGVAHHAARLGLPATIVMPEGTPFTKIARTRALGAEVIVAGDTVDASADVAHQLATQRGLEFIHPYDDPLVIAGQGTATQELLDDHPDLDLVVTAVGGGGLAAGAALAASGHATPVSVVGVQSERYPAMADLLASRASTARPGPTIADGIAVKNPGAITSQILADHEVDVVTVTEASIERAIAVLLDVEKTVTEGAGAAALAALFDHRDRFAGKNVGLLLCGGNIDPRTLSVVTLRGLAADGRLVRLQVEVDDRPGALAEITQVLADEGANVVEVSHHRLGSVGARSTRIEFLLDTLDEDHIDRVMTALVPCQCELTRIEP